MSLEQQPPASPPAMFQNQHRFEALDALRGIAALTVVQVHLPFLFAADMPFPHAYLAVDFFFMLSGFVLSYAYGARLNGGWPTLRFLRERIIRLYPLYLFALPFGFFHLLYTSRRAGTPLSHLESVVVFLFALVMLPLPHTIGPTTKPLEPFPANGPSWSLFYELLANVAHALFLRSRTRVQLVVLASILALLLTPVAFLHRGLNIGFLHGEFWGGLVRVMFSYVLGMILLEVWRGGKLKRFRSLICSILLLGAFLLSPVLHKGNAVIDLFAVFVAFPTVILLAANGKASPKFAPLVNLLGTMSYAIYVLHVPMYAPFTTLWGTLLHSKTADHAPLSGAIYLLFLLAVCYVLDRFYDLPVRKFLRGKTRTAKPRRAANT